MNAMPPSISLDMDDAERFILATEIAAEHVDYWLQRQTSLSIARAIYGQHWCNTFNPTRGQLVEAYARVWLRLGAA